MLILNAAYILTLNTVYTLSAAYTLMLNAAYTLSALLVQLAARYRTIAHCCAASTLSAY